MPEYPYRCVICGVEVPLQFGMNEKKPRLIPLNHVAPDGEDCAGVLMRRFAIPGLHVHYTDEWVIRSPGKLERERRDAKWRRKNRPDLYERE